ncbi:oligosaccharide repeat unit polymerase [Xenorhabdus bovienii]|uniref:O-antigen polymerase n=1 Tax=Xenorhabdus bovienii TaxID=40576 RepID=UPI0023B347E2|nr:O-antigen polymerase [Xenorhabdus bovienii]MDE9444130.1 oligosaccharide repeat unit polymerase [Xenorhabdus bovienii]
MSDTLFFDFIFSHYSEYLIYAFISCMLCYLAVRRLAVGILDPIHFYFTFSFGTSYAVVFILWIYNYISSYLFGMIALNFIFLYLSMALAYKIKRFRLTGFSDYFFKTAEKNTKITFTIIALIYIFLTVIYIKSVSFDAFIQSRFEANKGLGALVRILDVIRLMLTAYLAIKFFETKGFKRFIYIILALSISIFASFVSGAKASLLEHVLVMLIALYISKGWRPKFNFRFAFVGCILSVCLISYVLFMLQFTSEAIGYTKSQYINGPVEIELFLLRIFANADMYYFSLPNGVIDRLHVGSSIGQLFGYIIGNGGMQSIFGYDYSGNDVGRLIWKFWYPNDNIARGPTNHFDLAGYSYFGYVGGIMMTMVVGWIIGRVSKAKNARRFNGYFYSCFLATLYCRALQIFLSPSVGIAYILDILVFIVFIFVISELIAILFRSIVSPIHE